MLRMVNRFIRNIASVILITYLLYIFLTLDDEFLTGFLSEEDSSNPSRVRSTSKTSSTNTKLSIDETDPINLIVVSCSKSNYQGIREIDKPLSQAVTMMKSAVLFATRKVHIHIFTEENMKQLFSEELNMVKTNNKDLNFDYTIRLINYETIPEGLRKTWKSWYKPCGSFRLLTPFILPEFGIKKAIYADSDVLWIRPIDLLWEKFDDFSDKNVMASTPTAPLIEKIPSSKEQAIKGYYDKNDKYIFDHLHRGLYQINTGVLLMDFTRMLTSKWSTPKSSDHLSGNNLIDGFSSELLVSYYDKYSAVAEHDQKLMNYVFHYNSEHLYALPCEFNWKTDYCMPEKKHLVCEQADKIGAVAIHGTTSAFYSTDHPVLKILFRIFKEFDWMTGDQLMSNEDLGGDLEVAIAQSRHDQSYCANKMQPMIVALKESSVKAKAYRKSVLASKKSHKKRRT